MRWFLTLFLASFADLAAAQDRMPVAIELVLALDSSASVDRREFELQLDGLSQALSDPDVLKAVDGLAPLGAVISVVQWGGPGDTRVVLPFRLVHTAREAKAFAYLVSRIQRWHRASETSIADAISDSAVLLASNEFDGVRLVIDVSGDGVHNGAADLETARVRAVRGGITVNGLAIEADDHGLTQYYRDNVIAGSGSFVERAQDFRDFARAMREKLMRELRPLNS
jgi:hypothetical protein